MAEAQGRKARQNELQINRKQTAAVAGILPAWRLFDTRSVRKTVICADSPDDTPAPMPHRARPPT
jgi:hypothetical protein